MRTLRTSRQAVTTAEKHPQQQQQIFSMAAPQDHLFPTTTDRKGKSDKHTKHIDDLMEKAQDGDPEALAEVQESLAFLKTKLNEQAKAQEHLEKELRETRNRSEDLKTELDREKRQIEWEAQQAATQRILEVKAQVDREIEETQREADIAVEEQRRRTEQLTAELEQLRLTQRPVPAAGDTGVSAALLRHLVSPPPKFKGKVDEDAEVHILKVEDWFVDTDLRESDKVKEFCKTLEGESRLWYESQEVATFSWRELKQKFSSRFTSGGDSSRSWLTKWANLSFNPLEDDIHKWVYNVQKIAKRCNYGELAVVERIKFHMPPEMEAALLGLEDLGSVTKKVIEYFSGKATAKREMFPLPQMYGSTHEGSHNRGNTHRPMTSSPENPARPVTFQEFLQTVPKRHSPVEATEWVPGNPHGDFQEMFENFLAFQQHQGRPNRGQSRPYKPFITQGRGRPSFRGNSFRGRGRFQQNRNFHRSRSQSRDRGNRWNRSSSRNRHFQPRDPPTCWNCDQKGHMSFECRSQATSPRRARFSRSRSPSTERSRPRFRDTPRPVRRSFSQPGPPASDNRRAEDTEGNDRNGTEDEHETLTDSQGHIFPDSFNSIEELN